MEALFFFFPFFLFLLEDNCFTKAKDIKKRLQEYTEELYKKDLHDPDNHDGVITHLEPDFLECNAKSSGPEEASL